MHWLLLMQCISPQCTTIYNYPDLKSECKWNKMQFLRLHPQDSCHWHCLQCFQQRTGAHQNSCKGLNHHHRCGAFPSMVRGALCAAACSQEGPEIDRGGGTAHPRRTETLQEDAEEVHGTSEDGSGGTTSAGAIPVRPAFGYLNNQQLTITLWYLIFQRASVHVPDRVAVAMGTFLRARSWSSTWRRFQNYFMSFHSFIQIRAKKTKWVGTAKTQRIG